MVLKHTTGVINLVYWLSQPVVVSDSEMQTLRNFLNEHTFVQLEKFPVGRHATLQTVETSVTEWEREHANYHDSALLPSLGYKLVAEPAGSVTVVELGYSRKEVWKIPVQA